MVERAEKVKNREKQCQRKRDHVTEMEERIEALRGSAGVSHAVMGQLRVHTSRNAI